MFVDLQQADDFLAESEACSFPREVEPKRKQLSQLFTEKWVESQHFVWPEGQTEQS